MEHLGARLTLVEPGRCEIAAPHQPPRTRQYGYFHGGVMAALADSAAGYAAFSLMPAEATVLTVEYSSTSCARGRVTGCWRGPS
jgi:uncharacterized protein (TIGR00369 family)